MNHQVEHHPVEPHAVVPRLESGGGKCECDDVVERDDHEADRPERRPAEDGDRNELVAQRELLVEAEEQPFAPADLPGVFDAERGIGFGVPAAVQHPVHVERLAAGQERDEDIDAPGAEHGDETQPGAVDRAFVRRFQQNG